MRNGAEFRDQISPVRNALAGILFHDVDVRGGGQHVALESILKSVIDREGDHQRHHARRHANDGNHGDDGDNFLFAARAQIASGDKQLERGTQRSFSDRHSISRCVS